MTLTQVRKRGDYWKKESDGVTVGLDYEGRFNMTRHRFENLMKCVSFTTVQSLDVDYEVDDWRLVKPLIDAMNEQWASNIIPGLYLCIDECMCAWKGRYRKYYGVFGLPHVTKIARKPKGDGLELKALACGICGLLLMLEIQECKASMAMKDFVPEFGSGTALCLRLTKNYWNSNRIVCGDSAFSSVKTARQMLNKAWQLKDAPRGSSLYLKTTVQERHCDYPLLATGWKDKNVKYFISTCGVTRDGPDAVKDHQKTNDIATTTSKGHKFVMIILRLPTRLTCTTIYGRAVYV
eukprot:Pgem_evm1s19058